MTRCPATELALDVPGGETVQCVLVAEHSGEHQCYHGFHFAEDKKLCLTHQMSRRLCGCEKPAVEAPKPDTHRDFTELAVGSRVRFAHALRTIELCGQCRLPAVLLESKHRGVKRRAWIHDAVVGPAGYQVGAGCVEYTYPAQRKKKKLQAGDRSAGGLPAANRKSLRAGPQGLKSPAPSQRKMKKFKIYLIGWQPEELPMDRSICKRIMDDCDSTAVVGGPIPVGTEFSTTTLVPGVNGRIPGPNQILRVVGHEYFGKVVIAEEIE